MRILISNDDGIEAPGILAMAEGLAQDNHHIFVVAPDRDRSGASNSLTLDQPLRVRYLDERRISVSGTPTDCVHLALSGLLPEDPDIVLSGINNTANLGDDVIYSGTVAAAMEGRCLGLPAIALSCASSTRKPKYYESSVRVAKVLIERLLSDPLPADTILNVNIPDLPWQEIQGFEVTRLGHRHRAEPCIPQTDPRGRAMWWIGPAGPEQDGGPGTDFHAIKNGFISITPIHVDLTRYQALEKVSGWVSELSKVLSP
ncbi:MAG TPA: 5'/3'-nucleotidase SurE [Arenimonas sp.]|nr:5'/3'-nucleotidase SurE [Arenimonas sp.]